MDPAKKVYRIGIFTRPIDQGTSGSGHHLHEIVRHLIKLNEGRFEFVFIHYIKKEIDIYENHREIIIPRNPFKAASILQKTGIDLYHYSPLTPFAPIWGIKVPKVATIHGIEPVLVPQFYAWKHRFHVKYSKPWLCRRMDHIFTVSKTSCDYFSRNYRIPMDRFSVCYNAVNSRYKRLKVSKEQIRKKYTDGNPYFFHISRFSERKNPWTMLKAFNRILKNKESPSFRFVLAGKGWNDPRVIKYCANEGILDNVVLPGFLAEESVVELFNGCEAFLFPSLAEGFGMPNIEAMACGAPVITSSVFAIPEIVGDAALVMKDPLDDKELFSLMERVLSEDEIKTELIQKGFERQSLFSWDESAKTILDVYSRLTGNKE